MKSHESDQVELLCCVLRDAASKCAATPSVLRDLMTIRSRVEYEGLSFVTITLPTFGKEFEKALADCQIGPTHFRSFKKCGAIPAFLKGMLSLVFDIGTGRRLENVDPQAIEGVRQVAYTFKKLEMDCTPKRVRAALNNFKSVEHELSEAAPGVSDCDAFVNVADVLWSCLSDIDIRETVPRHGPGATAERIAGNGKYAWQTWHERLEPYFPFLDTALTIGAYGSKEFENVTFISEEQELPVKVTPVPKTLKGPRIIAIEPVCMQYAQQAVRATLYRVLESSYLTAGHVNFTDQMVNRDLAMKSSIDGSMATLDLSDASDRVLCDLAMRMFDCNPDLRDAILACRSTKAKLPDGTVIGPLKKFASMGSALCFPVESMYFYTICVVALLAEQHLPVTSRNIYKVSRGVYIYGDDIIVPVGSAATVVDYLQKYYCKVNITKSFWTGGFRESCGMDAYEGTDVTPVYVHCGRPTSRRQACELVSWVSSMNAFYKKGYMETSAYLQKGCERHLGILPIVSETSSVLGRILDAPLTTGRWNEKIQVAEVRGWVASPVRSTDELQGYGALMKTFLNVRRDEVVWLERLGLRLTLPAAESYTSITETRDGFVTSSTHSKLTESVQRNAVTLKRCWCAA